MVDATEQDYMQLREGAGEIPEKFRNRGYDKLDYGPGEGGFRLPDGDQSTHAGGDPVQAFLAGVASGADPKQLAEKLAGTKTTRRGR